LALIARDKFAINGVTTKPQRDDHPQDQNHGHARAHGHDHLQDQNPGHARAHDHPKDRIHIHAKGPDRDLIQNLLMTINKIVRVQKKIEGEIAVNHHLPKNKMDFQRKDKKQKAFSQKIDR
jgi:hypothetical protein